MTTTDLNKHFAHCSSLSLPIFFPLSYVHRSHSFFIFLLRNERFRGAFGSLLGAVRPPHLFLDGLLVGGFAFTSFYKLANLLSLNLAERKFLAIFGVRVGVAYVIFGAFGVACASLATVDYKRKRKNVLQLA